MGAVIVVRMLSRAWGRFQGGNLQQPGPSRRTAHRGPSQGRHRYAGRDRMGRAQATHIVPLVGARRRDRLTEALGAAELTLSQRERNYRFIAASSGMAAPRRARSVSAGAKRRVQQQRSLPVVVRLSYHIPSGDGPATGVAGAMILSIAARSASLSETSAAARLSLTWFGCRAPTMATCTAGLASVQAMAN